MGLGLRAIFLALILLSAVVLFWPIQPKTGALRVAVASNFAPTAEKLAERFQAKTGTQVSLSTGSTGKHYAQIISGAPLDVFLAADQRRPERLETEGIVVPETRMTYAIGKLVLYSPLLQKEADLKSALTAPRVEHLAIANPALAPYGKAAQEALVHLKLWDPLSGRVVMGENISQVWHFLETGTAQIGFVARAQVVRHDRGGSLWDIPEDWHSPILQDAVLLTDSEAGRAFLQFLTSPEAQALIRTDGYSVPAHSSSTQD